MRQRLRSLRSLGALCLVVSFGIAPLVMAQDDGEKPQKHKKKKVADPDKTDESDPKDADKNADGEKADDGGSRLAPEARLCMKIAKNEVIRGLDIEPYLDLLTEANVADWNTKRKADHGKVLDLAGKTWDPKGRDDLQLKLEGLDLNGADLSNVVFMPGTSFKFSDLSGVNFHGSCLEGVTFTSVYPFEARSAKQVRSTSLVEADLRDAIWTWGTALERTVARSFEDAKRDNNTPETRQRRQMERQRRMEILQRQANGWSGDLFAFVDMENAKLDADSPGGPREDENDQGNNNPARSRTLERLVRAARAGTIEKAINRLTERRRAARMKECANPLKSEPALAEAIAAADSRLTGIETWKAMKLAEPAGRNANDEATIVGGPDILFVVDDERSVQGARLLVSAGPILAWCKAALPTTFSSSAVILKDQAYTNSVIHAHPVFALAETLRGERKRVAETAGTYHSEVITEVAGVENLSAADAERRALLDCKLRDYAQSQGDDMEYQKVWDPTKDGEGLEPKEALPSDVRKAIKAQVGKGAFADMKCYKLEGQKFGAQNTFFHVLCNDPKAILVIDKSFISNGSIYAEGPVVFLDGNEKVWLQRCVTKGWLAVRGQPHVGQFTSVGARVDIEAKPVEPEKPDPGDEKKPDPEPQPDK